MKKLLVCVLLAVMLVALLSVSTSARSWWKSLDPCEYASQSGWHHPGWVATCLIAIMLDGMHGEIWGL